MIAVEKLNIKGLARTRLAKSIHDAGWNQFLSQLVIKAGNAGRLVVAANPAGTSQTCPDCGAIKKKNLSERIHSCACGLECHRDHASARVILARALVSIGVNRLPRDFANDRLLVAVDQAYPLKKEEVLLSEK